MKARRFDLYPDDFIAGVAGELTEAELGVYMMVILLCYSHGGSIRYDPVWLRSKFRAHKGNRIVKPILDRLIASGKVVRDGNEITVRRVRDEVERSLRRIRDATENGLRGGRPSNKNNGEEKGSGSPARGRIQQSTTSNQQPKKDARAALKAEFAEWYLAYPHKVGPGAAEQKFAVARRSTSLAELLDGVVRYKRTKPADHPWCNPATWLYQRRWEDQPADLLAKVNGHAGPTGPPPAPIDPKKLGHSLPCHCGNCLRWAALTREDTHVEPAG